RGRHRHDGRIRALALPSGDPGRSHAIAAGARAGASVPIPTRQSTVFQLTPDLTQVRANGKVNETSRPPRSLAAKRGTEPWASSISVTIASPSPALPPL